MSESRPHLSIGEVLSLLQDEFPDITISKIRFLESQGLLNPERTPSGYRKFYDHDVEQLRWVLRQQKENFLPLKVIKDRLAAGQLDSPASESGVLDLAPAATGSVAPLGEATRPDRPTPVGATAPASSTTPAPRPPSRSAPDQRQSATRAPATPAAESRERVAATAPRSSAGGTPDIGKPASATAATSSTIETPRREAAARSGSGSGAAASPARGADRSGGSAANGAHPEAAMGSSASLTAEELCAATGVSPRLLGELERYGLVGGRSLGPEIVYDDEAMVICRLAAVMADAGIEARHLRMFKVAAEREAGLYEQLALPMVRGQRPEVRQEAVAQVTALTGTAAELHAALLRRALRTSLGPL